MSRIQTRSFAVALSLLAGCNLPRDAEGTLDRVDHGVLRVGVADSAPWVVTSDTAMTGAEVELVKAFAREVNARPEWQRGSEAVLLKALHDGKLDLVIGGFTVDSPWKATVAFTRPYEGGHKPQHVLAVAPGENAFLVRLETFLVSHSPVTPFPSSSGLE